MGRCDKLLESVDTQRPTYLIRERGSSNFISTSAKSLPQSTPRALPEYAHRLLTANPTLPALRPTRGISDKGGPEDDAERLQMLE